MSIVTTLFIGDPHVQTSNITEINLCLEKLIILAKDKLPTIIVIAGDLLHTHERLHTTALNKAYELVDEMRKISPTYVLVGNHDMENNQQFLTTNHWMNAMKDWDNTFIIDTVLSTIINDKQFLFVPYVPPGRFEEALNTLEVKWNEASCIFCHQEFFGCKMGAIISVEGDKWSLDNPHIISGHIHSKQTPQKNIYYSGSMLQHAFGESSKNIIAYLTFDDNKDYKLDEIDLQLPRKKIIYLDIEDIDKYNTPTTEDKIKITLTGNYEQFKAVKKTKKYKKLMNDGIKVVFKPKNIESKNDTKISESTNDFSSILNQLVNNQKNTYLNESYELVINNKKINPSDIMYI